MTSKTISTNEKDYLLSLVKNRQQYRMGVIFPSRMNNYYYDAGTGSILRLQDSEYRLLKAIFSPTATQESVNGAFLRRSGVIGKILSPYGRNEPPAFAAYNTPTLQLPQRYLPTNRPKSNTADP